MSAAWYPAKQEHGNVCNSPPTPWQGLALSVATKNPPAPALLTWTQTPGSGSRCERISPGWSREQPACPGMVSEPTVFPQAAPSLHMVQGGAQLWPPLDAQAPGSAPSFFGRALPHNPGCPGRPCHHSCLTGERIHQRGEVTVLIPGVYPEPRWPPRPTIPSPLGTPSFPGHARHCSSLCTPVMSVTPNTHTHAHPFLLTHPHTCTGTLVWSRFPPAGRCLSSFSYRAELGPLRPNASAHILWLRKNQRAKAHLPIGPRLPERTEPLIPLTHGYTQGEGP